MPVPQTFFVIIGTAALYGLTAPLVARRLGLAKAEPQGVLFLGGRFRVREMAKVLLDEGYAVMLVDNSLHNVSAARMAGIRPFMPAYFPTPCWTVSRSAGSETHGHDQQRRCQFAGGAAFRPLVRACAGRFLFGKDMAHAALTQWFTDEAVIKKTRLSGEFGFKELKARMVRCSLCS